MVPVTTNVIPWSLSEAASTTGMVIFTPANSSFRRIVRFSSLRKKL